MRIFRLVYVSNAEPCPPQLVSDILSEARSFNPKHNVTGMLVYDGKTFLQLLEGARPVVNKLFNKISQDDRHSNVELISAAHATSRIVPGWSMAFLGKSEKTRRLLMRFQATPDYSPYNLDAAQASQFFELVASESAADEFGTPEAED